jgi:hypothetical protein
VLANRGVGGVPVEGDSGSIGANHKNILQSIVPWRSFWYDDEIKTQKFVFGSSNVNVKLIMLSVVIELFTEIGSDQKESRI